MARVLGTASVTKVGDVAPFAASTFPKRKRCYLCSGAVKEYLCVEPNV